MCDLVRVEMVRELTVLVSAWKVSVARDGFDATAAKDVLLKLQALCVTGEEVVTSGAARAITCNSLANADSPSLREGIQSLRARWKRLHEEGPTLKCICKQLQVHRAILGPVEPVAVVLAMRACEFNDICELDEADPGVFDSEPADVRGALEALIAHMTALGRRGGECQVCYVLH